MRACSVPYKVAHTLLYSNIHADLISIRKAKMLHSNFIILQKIFISEYRAWMMMVMMMEPLAILAGYLQHFMPPSLSAHNTYF